MKYEKDPEAFNSTYTEEQQKLAEKIIKAREFLPKVEIDDKLLGLVAGISVELGVDGHRADITLIKTALTVAAFNGHGSVDTEDIKAAAKLVLPHRMRRRPFEEGELDWSRVYELISTGV